MRVLLDGVCAVHQTKHARFCPVWRKGEADSLGIDYASSRGGRKRFESLQSSLVHPVDDRCLRALHRKCRLLARHFPRSGVRRPVVIGIDTGVARTSVL